MKNEEKIKENEMSYFTFLGIISLAILFVAITYVGVTEPITTFADSGINRIIGLILSSLIIGFMFIYGKLSEIQRRMI